MMADLEGYIPQFEQFFTSFHQREIERVLKDYPKNRSIEVDIGDLLRFDIDLANALGESPDDLIKAAETAVERLKIATPSGEPFKPHVRFYGLPDRNLLVEQIGSMYLNKLFAFKYSPSSSCSFSSTFFASAAASTGLDVIFSMPIRSA